MQQSGFNLPTETNLREAWVRVMRDSRTGETGGLLPSEAADLVAKMFGTSALVVLLAAGSTGAQAVGVSVGVERYRHTDNGTTSET